MDPKGILKKLASNPQAIGLTAFASFLILLVIYLGVQYSKFEPKTVPITTKIEDQHIKLPNFPLDIDKDKQVSFYDFQGKVVLLSFWASWCAPCLVELPLFEKLKQKIDDDDFVIVPVNLDEAVEDGFNFVKRFWPEHKLSFTTYYDFDKSLPSALAIGGLPTNYLVDKNSFVVFESSGLQNWLDPEIIKLIEEALDAE